MPRAVEYRLVFQPLVCFSAALVTGAAELLRVNLQLDSALGVAASTAPKQAAGNESRRPAVTAESDLELFSARIAACWAHLADWRSTTLA